MRRRTPQATRLEIGRASRSPHVGVASDRVYRGPQLPAAPVGSYPAFPPLPSAFQSAAFGRWLKGRRRYISVALVRRSPSA